MKKLLLKILVGAMAVCVLLAGLVACGNGTSSWKGTSMTNHGAIISDGGFIAESENYLYYINGIPTSTSDNTLGTPIKGALMAADKSDLSKTEVVVPKLFAATDYNSGLFFDGDYVYYGTPNTDKAGDGSVANYELVIMKTSLDGKTTEKITMIGALGTEYRFVKSADTVYIVYYNVDDSSLIAFDTAKKTSTVIAKTDAEAESNYSLSEYKFVSTDDGIAVAFIMTVYAEPYLADKAESSDYQRLTENYNVLCAYKAGDAVDQNTGFAGKVVLDGKQELHTYKFTYAETQNVYFTATPVTGAAKTFGASISDLYANGAKQEVINSAYLAEANLVVSMDEVYVYADSKIYKASLVGADNQNKQVVALSANVSNLLFVKGNDIYFIDTANHIARIEMNNQEAKEIIVSERTTTTTWYAPEVITIGEKDYLFYLDNSALGAGYVHYQDLGAQVQGEDTDDDGEDDSFNLGAATFMGKRTETDNAAIFTAKVANLNSILDGGALPMEKNEEGKLAVKEVEKVRAEYNALSEQAKKQVAAETLKDLAIYEKAIVMANEFNKLEGMYGYANKDADTQEALRKTYHAIKQTIKDFFASEDYSLVEPLINDNIKWYYTAASEEFGSDK